MSYDGGRAVTTVLALGDVGIIVGSISETGARANGMRVRVSSVCEFVGDCLDDSS